MHAGINRLIVRIPTGPSQAVKKSSKWALMEFTVDATNRRTQMIRTHTNEHRLIFFFALFLKLSKLQFPQIQLFNLKFIPAESNSSEIHYRWRRQKLLVSELFKCTNSGISQTHKHTLAHCVNIHVENVFSIWYTHNSTIFLACFGFFSIWCYCHYCCCCVFYSSFQETNGNTIKK